jgi:hypothetical protein
MEEQRKKKRKRERKKRERKQERMAKTEIWKEGRNKQTETERKEEKN